MKLLEAAAAALTVLHRVVETGSTAGFESKAQLALWQLQEAVAAASHPPKTSVKFDAFWRIYPRRIDKAGCLRTWIANDLDSVADKIIAHVAAKAKTADWIKEGFRFVPHPKTYLNQRRWEEVIGTVVDDGWWKAAGFSSRYDAENSGCHPHNHTMFSGGRRAT